TLAQTLRGLAAGPASGDITVAGKKYRARFQSVDAPPLAPVGIGVADRFGSSSVAASRILIGGILLAFLVLALASSVLVVRALQGQIGDFLAAARRLAGGNFDEPVPIYGSDEFAALGV